MLAVVGVCYLGQLIPTVWPHVMQLGEPNWQCC
jgi:hypothetical protein